MLLGIKTVYKGVRGVHLESGFVTLWVIPVSIKGLNGRSRFIRLLHARFYLKSSQWESNDYLRHFYSITQEYTLLVYTICPEFIAVKKSIAINGRVPNPKSSRLHRYFDELDF